MHHQVDKLLDDSAMGLNARTTLALAALTALSTPTNATVVRDEALSGAAIAPTRLEFRSDSTIVMGSVQAPADVQDFLQFTIPPGFQLSALWFPSYDDPTTPVSNDGNRGYHALLAGTLGLVPTPANRHAFLGGNHLDPQLPGADLLPLLGGAGRLAGVGFSGLIGPGNYVYLIQQTGPELSAYQLDFVLTPVPVPAAQWLTLPAWLALAPAIAIRL